MRPLHERFLDAIDEERQRLSTRRGVLTGSAKLAAGGGLALALAGAPLGGVLPAAAAGEFKNDLEILNYALTLEHLEATFYRDGLKQFGEGDFTAGVYATLTPIRDHEKAHVDALTATVKKLKGTPVEEQTYDFGYGTDAAAFLKVAAALENTGVAAYHGAAPSIKDKGVLDAALGIHSVEARHASYLNLLTNVLPFPDAVDAGKTKAQVLKIAGPFITGGATPQA